MSVYKSAASRRGMQGDPFIGALARVALPGIGKLAKFVGSKVLKRGGAVVGAAATALTIRGALPRTLPVPTWVGGGRGFDLLPSETAGMKWPTNKDGRPRRARKDGKPWKRPSMNFANGRAIRRAARRLEGAEKMFRRVFSIRHGGSAGRVVPKKRK